MATFVERQRSARETINYLSQHATQVIVIHYSCESFYDLKQGASPRVTSIACRKYASGQTRSFSIHHYAELPEFHGKSLQSNYEEVEKKMLEDFFVYVQTQEEHAFWVHWNMRDINYGFAAIEHRYKVLGGSPVLIPDRNKFDLARLLVSLYGKRYIGHPRLENVTRKNTITDRDMLAGKDEAYAFKDGEFLKLHQSTLRKVDVISNILERVIDNSLKTDARFWDLHGGVLRLVTEKYILKPITAIVTGLITVLALIEWLYPNVKNVVAEHIQNLFGN